MFIDIAGLDMILQEWKSLCQKSWENEYEYLQIDKLAKMEQGRFTIRDCKKNTYLECTPEMKPFCFLYK